eukprot:m.282559 g.282559  ORF g.282559 m.282559 type:complete len:1368 (+) comp40658_c0_seq13:550-4653(+)
MSKSDSRIDEMSPPLAVSRSREALSGPTVADFVAVLHGDDLLTDEEAQAVVENMQSIPVEMQTDSMRIILMNMVKHGKLTVPAVEQYAAQFEIDSQSRKKEPSEIHNFSVYKWNKMRNTQRRILQFDFKTRTLLNMARGQINKTFSFADVVRYEGDENERFYIYFANHHEYELEADSIEEKNEICKILNRIIDENNAAYDSGDDQLSSERSSTSETAGDIKQGQLEKKGHSAAFFTWAKRWVKVVTGEISYFKMDDFANPLNSIQLGPGFATLKKEDFNGFVVSTSTKDFHFRISNPNNQRPINAVSSERDSWVEALMNASSFKKRSTRVSESQLKSQSGTIDMIKMLRKELKLLGQSMSITYGSNVGAAPLKKVQQMAKAIEEHALREPFQSPAPSPIKPAILTPSKESGFKSFRSKLKRKAMAAIRPLSGTSDSFRKMAQISQISAPVPIARSAANANQPAFVSATSALVPSLTSPTKKPTKSLSSSVVTSTPPPLPYAKRISVPLPSGPIPTFSSTENAEISGSTNRASATLSMENEVFEKSGTTTEEIPAKGGESGDERCQNVVNEITQEMTTYTEILDPPDEQGGDYAEIRPLEKTGQHLPVVSISQPTLLEKELEPPPPPPPLPPMESEPELPFSASLPPPPPSLLSSGDASSPPPLSPGGAPPPPPPPGMGGFGAFKTMNLPPKNVVTPGRKMRPLHWFKVPNMMVPKSFWMNAEDRTNEINADMLEEMFCVEETAPSTVLKKSSTLKCLQDSKRAQNLGIFLSGFKLSIEEIDARLYEVDEDKGLPLEHVIALKRFQPTTEDREMYKNFEGEKMALGSTDQFMMKLCDLPNLPLRLELLLTIREFPLQFEELLPSISTALGACNELENNANFCIILEYALSIGNYLNGGTSRGCAYGVKLSSLQKLGDTRARGNAKYTLLHYLVDVLKDKDPAAMRFVNEMPNMSKAGESSVKALAAEVEIMKKDLQRISRNADNLLKKEENPRPRDVTFNASVKKFVRSYQKEADLMSRQGEQLESVYRKVLLKYGEPDGAASADLFSSVRSFIDLFKKAMKDQVVTKISTPQPKEADSAKPPCAGERSSPNLLAQIAADQAGLKKPKRQTSQKQDKETSPPKEDEPSERRTLDERPEQAPSVPPAAPILIQTATSGGETAFDETNSSNRSSATSNDNVGKGKEDSATEMPAFPILSGPVSFASSAGTTVSRESGGSASSASFVESSPPSSKRLSHGTISTPPLKRGFNSVDSGMEMPFPPRSFTVSGPVELPIMEGYLEKMSGGKKRAPKWDSRFFELCETGYLHYYRKKDSRCLGSVYLRGCPISIDSMDNRIIKLQSEDRTWYFRAQSGASASSWKKALVVYTTR